MWISLGLLFLLIQSGYHANKLADRKEGSPDLNCFLSQAPHVGKNRALRTYVSDRSCSCPWSLLATRVPRPHWPQEHFYHQQMYHLSVVYTFSIDEHFKHLFCACNDYFFIIFDCLCYFSCPHFFPFACLYPAPPPGNPHTVVHINGSCIYALWFIPSPPSI